MIRWTLFALAAAPALAAQAPPPGLSTVRQVMWAELRVVNDSMEAAFNGGD